MLNHYLYEGKLIFTQGIINNPKAVKLSDEEYAGLKNCVLFNAHGIKVLRQYNPQPLGIQYLVQSGEIFFTTSVEPKLDFVSLREALDAYTDLKADAMLFDHIEERGENE